MKLIFIFLLIIFILVSGIFWFTRTDGWKLDYGKSAAVTTSAEVGQLQSKLQGKRITVSGTVTAINGSDSLVLDNKVTVRLHPRIPEMISYAKISAPIKVAGILRREDGKLVLNPSIVLSND